MEVTTQNSYFKFWILHEVGVGNGLNNDFLHFPPNFFCHIWCFFKVGTHKKEIHSSNFQATFQFTSWINVWYLKILNFLSVYYMLEILSWTYIDRPNCVWHFDIFAKIYNEKEWTHTKILKIFSSPFSTTTIWKNWVIIFSSLQTPPWYLDDTSQ